MFSFEKGPGLENQENKPELHIESRYDDFLPEDFKSKPQKYIEDLGENIKSGEIKYHEDGRVREDPTASKFLPEWQNSRGEVIQPISKKVNLEKVITQIEPEGEKFYDSLLEYKMMTLCQILDLPSAKPIGFVKQDDKLYTIMEKVRGYTWTKKDKEILGKLGLNTEDEESIKRQIKEQMNALKEKLEEFGIYRKWKHKDMILGLDIEHKIVDSIIPVDWERSYLDKEKLMQMISNFSPEDQQKIEEVISLKA